MSFCHLHVHSHIGSQLDGVGDPMEYAKLAKEKGHPALAVTDHGKMNAFFKHNQACTQYGIKPIFGVEAYVDFELERLDENTGKRIRNKNMHLIILAKDEEGYNNLLKLNYISMADEKHFYYKNMITIQELFDHKKGLIVGSGCGNSPFNMLFREGKEKEADELYGKFVDEFGDLFYTELHMSELDSEEYNQKKINEFELRMAKKYNRLVVLAGDVHYDLPGKDKIQTLAIAIRNRDNIDNLSFEIESKNLYYHDIDDYKKFNKQWNYGYTNKQIDEWCNNTVKIADKIYFEMRERNKMHLPTISSNDDELLIEKSKKGLMRIFNTDNYDDCPEEYKNRLSNEIKIIMRKGMSSYVLILEDIFRFADKENIMRGPSRGSGGGSLLLYCLDITTLDPIKYGLIFERFLSESRSPDVVYDWFGETI